MKEAFIEVIEDIVMIRSIQDGENSGQVNVVPKSGGINILAALFVAYPLLPTKPDKKSLYIQQFPLS